jgi:acylphosphatase
MIARRVRASGRVQGVFFRAWTRDEARSLRVCGWVRNCSDGSVEAHIEGEDEAVGELIKRMRHGPPHAQVLDLGDVEVEAQGTDRFEVRH